MSTRYNTGNQIESTDVRDMSDNAKNLDVAINTLDETWNDRFGVKRTSIEGAVQGLSFFNVGTFAAGYTLTNSRQTLTYDGHEYSWAGAFQKVVAAGSTPTPLGAGGWIDRSDVALRGDLSRQSGAGLVGGMPVFVTATKYAGGASTSSTNNDAAIAAAINDAIATGSYVYWPAVYEVQGNIPNFHSVRHDGPGGIKRGSDTFMAHALEWTQSTLYCSPTASSSGDGLSASSPMQIGGIRSVLLNYTPLIGSWDVKLAAGTYPIAATIDVGDILTASDFLKIEGPAVSYGVPTAIFDGTGSSAIIGFRCGGRQKVWLKDVKVQNFTQPNSTGVAGIDFCELWADNVHVNNCSFTGLSVSHGRMRVTGGIYEGCEYNLRAYNLTEYTFSYGGVGTICRNPVGFGACIQIRDGSSGVMLAGTQATGAINAYGIELINFCRARFTGITVTGNKIGLRTQFSTFFDDGSNSITGNTTTNFQLESSTDSNNAADMMFDPISKNRSWGGGSTSTFRYYFRKVGTGSGMSSNATFVVEDTSPVLGLMSDAAGIAGIVVGKPGVGSQASFIYNQPDNTWRWRINNADTYRMSSTFFMAMTDNAASLGSAVNRYSVVYAATGAVNTSDAREKSNPITPDQLSVHMGYSSDAILDAWGDVQLVGFQWLESIRTKGEAVARWHFGVIAQQVRDAFAARGIDGTRFGLLCYDEWQATEAAHDSDGDEIEPAREAGNRWGIRADQCLFLEAAYQRRNYRRLIKRIEALESGR